MNNKSHYVVVVKLFVQAESEKDAEDLIESKLNYALETDSYLDNYAMFETYRDL